MRPKKQQTVVRGTAWNIASGHDPSAAAGDNCVACVAPRWSSSHEGHRCCLACSVGSRWHCSPDECARRECARRQNLRRTGPHSLLTNAVGRGYEHCRDWACALSGERLLGVRKSLRTSLKGRVKCVPLAVRQRAHMAKGRLSFVLVLGATVLRKPQFHLDMRRDAGGLCVLHFATLQRGVSF